VEEVGSEKVRVAMLPLGETRIELLEPTSEDSVIARFLERRGEGIHHLALEVEDLDGACEELRAAGMRLVYDAPQPGEGGSRVNFIHPSSARGVLIELTERPQI
jgi:methylmalonyl-CoA epimerase